MADETYTVANPGYVDPDTDIYNIEDDEDDVLIVKAKNPKRTTLTLAALVLLGIGFLGGIEYQKHYGPSAGVGASSVSGNFGPRSAYLAGRSGAGGAGGFRSLFGGSATGSGGFGGLVTGTVANISGATLYVTEASGNTVAVSTSGATFSKTDTGTINDVLPGDTIVVRGSQQSDGSYEATSVSISPQASASAAAVGSSTGSPSTTSASGGAGFGPFG